MPRRPNTEYQTYLRAPYWRALAQRIKDERGNRCERCCSAERLDAHHLTYDRLFCELPEDIMVLCRECHMAIHERPTVNWAYARRLSLKEIRELVPDAQEGVEYTEIQLERLADKLLLLNPDDSRPVLFDEQIRSRRRREILTSVGVPDPSIVQGMYWRTHPGGRAWYWPDEMEEKQASFYREAHADIMGSYDYRPIAFKPLVGKKPKKTFVMGAGSLPSAKRESRRKSERRRRERKRLDKLAKVV